jgi:hypothetical protein
MNSQPNLSEPRGEEIDDYQADRGICVSRRVHSLYPDRKLDDRQRWYDLHT